MKFRQAMRRWSRAAAQVPRFRRSAKLVHEAVQITKNPYVSDLVGAKCEDRRTGVPYTSVRRLEPEHGPLMSARICQSCEGVIVL